ncbi:SdhA [Caligus rogercresseyi]|uniref:SdhA n=1 Tax=Caligus rogercresseyi TaxID=217165 RepID=A0A7T8K110_CALRO|nr:SdhA [Caligus rogercresseyi]
MLQPNGQTSVSRIGPWLEFGPDGNAGVGEPDPQRGCDNHRAEARHESRGAHAHEDFPDRDDKNWRVHSLATMDADNKATLTYRGVHIDPLTKQKTAASTQENRTESAQFLMLRAALIIGALALAGCEQTTQAVDNVARKSAKAAVAETLATRFPAVPQKLVTPFPTA